MKENSLADLLVGLVSHLKDRSDSFIKKERVNVVRKRVGYSEYTQWDTTVSFNEIQSIDFSSLLDEIDGFVQSFKDRQQNENF